MGINPLVSISPTSALAIYFFCELFAPHFS
jgi:hypothetical protein